MDIKVERFLKLNGCKKITDKEIIKVEDNYIYVKKSRDFLDTSYMVIDLEGNIIADRKCEYLKRDFFMINYCIYKKNKKIDKLQHVKIYDSFILGIFDDYMVLMDFDCNYISEAVYNTSDNSRFNKLLVDKQNNIVVIGSIANWKNNSNKTFTDINYDCIIGKYDTSLKEISMVIYGDEKDDYFTDIILADNSYLLVGYSFYEDGSYLSKFIKYSSALKILEVE